MPNSVSKTKVKKEKKKAKSHLFGQMGINYNKECNYWRYDWIWHFMENIFILWGFWHDFQSYCYSKLLAKSSLKETTSMRLREFKLIYIREFKLIYSIFVFPEEIWQGPSSKTFKETVLPRDTRECSLTDKEVVERQGTKAGAVFTAAGCHWGIPPGSQSKHVQISSSKGHEQWADKVFSFFKVKLFQ